MTHPTPSDFDPDLHELLQEDVLAAEAEVESGRAPTLSRRVRAAALAAFDATVATVPVAAVPVAAEASVAPAHANGSVRSGPRETPILVARPRDRSALRYASIAAVLLVALGAVFALRGPSAEAGMFVESIVRLDRSQGTTLEWHGSRLVPVGETLRPPSHECWAVALPGEGRVVLCAGDEARVAADEHLRLVAGEARLATRGAPIRLHVDRWGTLDLRQGAAHVVAASGSGREARGPAIALADGASATFERANGGRLELAGGTHVIVRADGAHLVGAAARSLFRDLEVFGGAVLPAENGPWIPARAWRVVEGDASRSGSRLVLRPRGSTTDDEKVGSVALAWRPFPEVRAARTLRLSIAGPAGTVVTLDGLDGSVALPSAVLPASGAGEPRVATVDVALPDGWTERLARDGARDAELLIRVLRPAGETAPGAPAGAAVRFEGAAFLYADTLPSSSVARGGPR